MLLHDLFLAGAGVVAIGIVFALLLVDIPLRQTNRPRRTSLETV